MDYDRSCEGRLDVQSGWGRRFLQKETSWQHCGREELSWLQPIVWKPPKKKEVGSSSESKSKKKKKKKKKEKKKRKGKEEDKGVRGSRRRREEEGFKKAIYVVKGRRVVQGIRSLA